MAGVSLHGKTALITGASGGIGRATARLLARSGADLILHAHHGRDTLEALLLETQSLNPAASHVTVYADLSLEAEQDRLIDTVSHICFAPDIFIPAAGADLMTAAMKTLSFEDRFRRIWQVDVVSAMRLARCFGERMKQSRRSNGGAIVLFGWDGVEFGRTGETAQLYAAAKGAVQGFAKSLAKSLAPEVRVNCVAPGWIKTTWGETASPSTDERVAAESLARRWGTADEIAEVVRFLVSDAATYVNGQTIHVNGGR